MKFRFFPLLLFWAILVANIAAGITANKVWMEFRDNGRYRVYVNYTLIEDRSYREAYAEFSTKREAERFFFNLVRGAEFTHGDVKNVKFRRQTATPQPW